MPSPIILDGKRCADAIAEVLKERVDNLKAKGINPKLIVFTSSDPASQVYVRNKVKRGAEIGIEVITKQVSSGSELALSILKEQKIPFIIQEPSDVPTEDVARCLNEASHRDMDGFSSNNLGKLLTQPHYSNQLIKPCTPAGILMLMMMNGISPENKNVVVIGRSNIVGKPMAILLTSVNATVTLCHSKTPYDKLIQHCEMADIIISATGQIDVLKGWKTKPNQVLVDVGMNRDENGKLGGDFSKETVENCYAYSPVPGGCGPCTIIELMRNTVEYWEKYCCLLGF